MGVVGTDLAAIAAVFGKDAKDMFRAPRRIIAHINKTGGIGGRKIEAVYHKGDSATDSNTNGQRACSALTEDTKVDIVVNVGFLGEQLPSCLQRRGVSVVDANWWASDAADAGRHPNWFQPVAMRADRAASALIDGSASRGVLKRGAKLGVLVEDCPWASRVFSKVVQPAAQRHGVSVVQGTVKCVENIVNDLGPVTNDIQRETVRFQGEDVSHVMTVSQAEAFLIAQFTQNASKQGFKPKYVVSSQAYPFGNSQSDATIKISPDALPNMSGLGYIPFLDVGYLATPVGAAQQAAQARCRQADPDVGYARTENGSGKYFLQGGFYAVCDTFYVTKALLEANGVRYSIADITAGYRKALNDRSFGSGALAAGHFGAGSRLDGAGAVRPFAYDTQRKRFSYTGGPSQVR